MLAVFLAACANREPSVPARAAPPAAPRTRLDLRYEPLADLYQLVRARASAREGVEAPPGLEEAVAAARRIHAKLGRSFLSWGVLDRCLIACPSAAALRERLARMPATVDLMDGGSVDIRDEALALGRALVEAEPRFRETVWPRHRATLDAARAWLAETLSPREEECLRLILDSFGMDDPAETIPVFIVAEAPWPGGVTYRRADGGGVCFIGLARNPGTLLLETLLHEATHVLDVRAAGKSALSELGERLHAAGVPKSSRLARNVWHALIFIQAGETVRRRLVPGHEHYGDARGVYARFGERATRERRAWVAYLDGEISRDAALRRIVEAMTGP